MIIIDNKENCCGCSACYSVCPHYCITMRADHEGFLYPVTDTERCTQCGLCEKVCPVINQEKSKEVAVYAAKSPDYESRKRSTSGGIFSLLAEDVLDKNGVVYGAMFNNRWEVIHGHIDRKDDLYCLRGSKYVQSNIGDCFREIKELLEKGKHVLFSGTPCQTSGLKLYLKRSYDNLLLVDVVCHGVPSPKVWKDYLLSLNKRDDEILNISFREKVNGWADALFTINDINGNSIISEPFRENIYMQGFMENIFLRPSCYKCPARNGRSRSDITLGDYWGVEKQHPNMADKDGVSLVIVNTEKGARIFGNIEIEKELSSLKQATDNRNLCILYDAKRTTDRDYFWKQYKQIGIDAIDKCLKHKKRPNLRRFCNKMLDKLKNR